MSGRLVHFEIPFDDGERARAFYRDTFGWEVAAMPELDYTMVASGPTGEQGMPSEPGFINGGMFRRDGGPLRSPVLVIDVASIDDTLATVEKQGGSVVLAKQPVGDMGSCAYFADPEGNVLGVWESA
jgi:uncharacterized protein